MLGWTSRRVLRHSFFNRLMRFGSDVSCGLIIFMAIWTSSSRSQTSQTCPMPPSPIISCSENRESSIWSFAKFGIWILKVNFRLFRFLGALYEKSRKYERPRSLIEAIFVILGAESDCSHAPWDHLLWLWVLIHILFFVWRCRFKAGFGQIDLAQQQFPVFKLLLSRSGQFILLALEFHCNGLHFIPE